MLISRGENFLIKLLRLRSDQIVFLKWSCPSSNDMLILQVQLPQSHVPADQLKVGCRCSCWSYGFLRGIMHNSDLFMHNLVSGLFWDVLQDWRHQRIGDGSIDGHPSHELFSLKQGLGWYHALRHVGFPSRWRCQLRQRGMVLRRLVNIQPIVFLAQHVWRCKKTLTCSSGLVEEHTKVCQWSCLMSKLLVISWHCGSKQPWTMIACPMLSCLWELHL